MYHCCHYVMPNMVKYNLKIVFNVSNGYKSTPKHIGTGPFIHNMTRSSPWSNICMQKKQAQLTKFEKNETFILHNIIPGRFVQFAANYLDIQEETLDGHDTLHVTQMSVFK